MAVFGTIITTENKKIFLDQVLEKRYETRALG